MRFTLKNPRFLQYIDYQNVRKTEFLGCQSQEKYQNITQIMNKVRISVKETLTLFKIDS